MQALKSMLHSFCNMSETKFVALVALAAIALAFYAIFVSVGGEAGAVHEAECMAATSYCMGA